ncbi:MAG: uracil-DNA glycosylase [Planctomycetota bacterium]|jgi:DNA polymerase
MTSEEAALSAERLRVRLEIDRRFGVDFARRSSEIPAAVTPAPKETSFQVFRAQVEACMKCPLAQTRRKVVFGEGAPRAELLFIGEAPGADEDREGKPFVGRAGHLLTRMIEAMGLTREEVFIGNVLKCRPPGNRDPAPAEVSACLPWLREQIRRIDPKVIVTLGKHALNALLEEPGPARITVMRGRFLSFEGRPWMPTFHPAYLLRNEGEKRKVWEDLKKVIETLGRTLPPRTRGSKST